MYSAFSSLLHFINIVSLISLSFQASAHRTRHHKDLLQCLYHRFSNSATSFNTKLIYTQNDPSFFSILNCSRQNPRFSTPSTPKPLVIVTPSSAYQVQASVYCCRKHGLQIRTRSGGHDIEGLSYVSKVPFVMIDLRDLSSITVDVNEKTAFVEAGATIGELYYRIAEKSKNLGFPAGVCHTVGVGGHFSGGGYGDLVRKYGLAADNIIDSLLVNVDGKILDRESMGEDLFWAIRGGGAASFGIVIAWKIQLVPVPSTVTKFTVNRNLEQNETMKLVNRWQHVADKLDEDLFMLLRFMTANISREEEQNKITIKATFDSVFLSGVDNLLALMEKNFAELGLKREDCVEMSWIESVYHSAGFSSGELEDLLNRQTQQGLWPFKAKLDYVTEPIPEKALKKMFERLYEEAIGMGLIQFFPYGGKMNEISKSKIPFPHRAGYRFKILYYVLWEEGEEDATAGEKHMNWVRSVYNYMTPYVSKNPRGAYLNYRDLDIGTNNDKNPTSYAQASIWGEKYFGSNFKRLVRVKTKVDPTNFFRDEQSIPPLPLLGIKKINSYGS